MSAARSTVSPSASRPSPAIKVGEIDGGGGVLRAQLQRGFVLGLGLGRPAALRKETSERGARFRPIGIEALGVDKFGGRALEPFAVGGRLARGRHHRQQRRCPDAHAAAAIVKQR